MASFATAAFVATARALPSNEAVSGIAGSISMTAWICLLIPQLIANYKAQSADGISMAFLIVWLIGDITNLTGALFTSLAPTAIALAIYFCIIDFILISQCLYYNSINAKRATRLREVQAADAREDSPLLGRERSISPGTSDTHGHHGLHTEPSTMSTTKTLTEADEVLDGGQGFQNVISILGICLVGFIGWFASYKAGAWDGAPPKAPESPDDAKKPVQIAGVVLGYSSAVLYLCARLPQIYKNYKEKSCEGLAVLFFLLSILGNLAYGVSLMSYSQDRTYLINAFPWLLGSLGTIFEDTIIFIQFRLYANNHRLSVTPA